jgi:polyisoprenyl-phosphate glycosyltransferase
MKLEEKKQSQDILGIVLPVFNEEKGIPSLLERIEEAVKLLSATMTVQVVFVDDHSSDRTSELLKEACRTNSAFKYIRLSVNSGSHVAIIAGMEHVPSDCTVFLASDLQDPPELIPEMVAQWRTGAQVVWATRQAREGVSCSEILFSRLFYWLVRTIGGSRVPPQGSDFVLLDQHVVSAILKSSSHRPNLLMEIAVLGFREARVGYIKKARTFSVSKWSLEAKLRMVINSFVQFSYIPLRAMVYVGIMVSMFGGVYALYLIYYKLYSSIVIEGWTELMVVILIIGGIQMVMLGVIGEYLWRILEESRQGPRYFLEERQLGEPKSKK